MTTLSKRSLWLIVMALLVVAGVYVPYGLLGGRSPGFMIAGFWLLFGVGVAIMVILGTARWKDES